METVRLFVGRDKREPVAFYTFVESVLNKTKAQVSITPVSGEQRDGSNSFIYQRFLVPWMCGYNGWALFCDGDMTCRADIKELWDLREPGFDVLVVKHEYATKYPNKYLGQPNENYPSKNWSSVMLINCGNYPWRKITPEYVSKAKGSHLHRFEFLKPDRIGELPKEWNWLSLEYDYNPEAKLVHHTIGTCCWAPYSYLDPYSVDWKREHQAMNYFQPWNPDDSKTISER